MALLDSENPFVNAPNLKPDTSDLSPQSNQDYDNSLDGAVDQAEADGLIVVKAADHELFLDFDTAEAYNDLWRRLAIVRRHYQVKILRDTPSSSGLPHRHVILAFYSNDTPIIFTPWARMAWEAALGSDGIRAVLNNLRVMEGQEFPSLFFERPEK